MTEQKRLLLSRNIFILMIFIALGTIVVSEKSKDIFLPKAEEKLSIYLKDNYSNLEGEVNKSKVSYDNNKYKMKITNKKNKNLYFYIYYSNKKYNDTYKKDYLKGNSLFTKINKDLEKEITSKINTNIKVESVTTLDKYTTIVRDRIISEEDLLSLKFYNIKKEIAIDNWSAKSITSEITKLIDSCYKEKITPKNYIITITNTKDITESIEINNLDEDFLKNNDKESIINDILNKKNSSKLEDSKIEYRYLN